jgi:hypothetical protein
MSVFKPIAFKRVYINTQCDGCLYLRESNIPHINGICDLKDRHTKRICNMYRDKKALFRRLCEVGK